MRIYVFKNVNYYGIFEKGQYCPVTANSIEKLKENAVEEVYRYSAFCEKKVPNDSDKIEIILTKSVNEVFCENTFSLLSITKKDFDNLKNVVIQTAFSYKNMVESLKEINVLDLFSFINYTKIESNEGILSNIFNVISYLENLPLIKAYSLLMQIYYNLTITAKADYYALKSENKKIYNLFYFGV